LFAIRKGGINEVIMVFFGQQPENHIICV
jgi:hypothetical protein